MSYERWGQQNKPRKETYYDLLEVNSTASEREIREAFINLSKKYHPSAEGGGDEEKYKTITEAYTALKSPERRVTYDMNGASEEAGSSGDGSQDLFEDWWSIHGKRVEDFGIGSKAELRKQWNNDAQDGKEGMPYWAREDGLWEKQTDDLFKKFRT